MKVYKILHKPTGLFFMPSRGYGNLSTKGKVYSKLPSINWVGDSVRIILKKWGKQKISKKDNIIIDHFKIEKLSDGNYWIDRHFTVPPTDWEIIEL